MSAILATDTRMWGTENIFFALLGVSIAASHGLNADQQIGFDLAIAAMAAVFGVEYQEVRNGLIRRNDHQA